MEPKSSLQSSGVNVSSSSSSSSTPSSSSLSTPPPSSSSASTHWSKYSHIYTALGLGQCISILIAGTGVFSTYLAMDNIFIPTSQSTINYSLLFVTFLVSRSFQYRSLRSYGRMTLPDEPHTEPPVGSTVSSAFTPANDSVSSIVRPGVGVDSTPPTTGTTSSISVLSPSFDGFYRYLRYVFTLSVPWYYYLILAIADVEANYVIVQAYHYTTITSIMLLDCSTIPIVMLLSTYVLKRKYNKYHFIGIGICLCGIGILILSDIYNPPDSSSDSDSEPPSTTTTTPAPVSPFSSTALWGDFLCLIASTLYAISNVGQEYIVKQYNRAEFLGIMGGIGILLSIFQIIFTGEYTNYSFITWTSTTVGSFLGFGLCLFAMYLLTSYFLVVCDATIFNLSLLTSDIWAIFAAYFLFHYNLSALYFLAFFVICGGLVLYHRADNWKKLKTRTETAMETTERTATDETNTETMDGVP